MKRKILNPQNQVLPKSTSVCSNNSINNSRRQISLIGTDHFNYKLSKVIQFEKKESLISLILQKICTEIMEKTIFLVYS